MQRASSGGKAGIVPVRRWDEPAARIVCFGHAGTGSGLFARWYDAFPAGVEVWAARLPGRERRIGEPLLTEFASASLELRESVEEIANLPLVFFGHCMGAYFGYDLCRSAPELDVVALAVSAQSAPHLPHPGDHLGSDAELVETVAAMGGTALEVLEHPEALSLFLPTLRADFALTASFAPQPPVELDLPILAFGALADPIVPLAELAAWRLHTRDFSLYVRDGEHFPSDRAWERMAVVLTRVLAPRLDAALAAAG
jgi:medium-chain acyl-[acyl-carrier-protein] hydrolase